MPEHIVALVTAGSDEEGHKIANALVEERLAACVNIVSPVQSVYRWQGRVQNEREVLLLVKTTAETFERLVARVKALHSYQVPEVIALPILAGAPDYLQWIDDETRQSTSRRGG